MGVEKSNLNLRTYLLVYLWATFARGQELWKQTIKGLFELVLFDYLKIQQRPIFGKVDLFDEYSSLQVARVALFESRLFAQSLTALK